MGCLLDWGKGSLSAQGFVFLRFLWLIHFVLESRKTLGFGDQESLQCFSFDWIIRWCHFMTICSSVDWLPIPFPRDYSIVAMWTKVSFCCNKSFSRIKVCRTRCSDASLSSYKQLNNILKGCIYCLTYWKRIEINSNHTAREPVKLKRSTDEWKRKETRCL